MVGLRVEFGSSLIVVPLVGFSLNLIGVLLVGFSPNWIVVPLFEVSPQVVNKWKVGLEVGFK